MFCYLNLRGFDLQRQPVRSLLVALASLAIMI